MIKEIITLNKTNELFRKIGWDDERISKAMLPELLLIISNYKARKADEQPNQRLTG